MLGRRRKRSTSSSGPATLKLYYASDVHGSERCWRKFLGAGRFYEVQALIMGGDLTGKAVVPIAHHDDGTWRTYFLGEDQTVASEDELRNLEEAIRFNGMYPWISTPEDVERHRNDPQLRSELFDRVMLDELRRWIELADERMAQYGIDVFVMG